MDHPSGPRRSTFLTLFLVGAAVLFLMVILIVATGGYVSYMIALAAGVFLLGWLHWHLWGRSLTQTVAGEREEEQLREQALADDWPLPDERFTPRRDPP